MFQILDLFSPHVALSKTRIFDFLFNFFIYTETTSDNLVFIT